MIDASFDSTKTPLRAGAAVEAYDEGPEEWDAEESIEDAAP